MAYVVMYISAYAYIYGVYIRDSSMYVYNVYMNVYMICIWYDDLYSYRYRWSNLTLCLYTSDENMNYIHILYIYTIYKIYIYKTLISYENNKIILYIYTLLLFLI